MATGKTNAGGGGAALNFKVVPNPQPSVAKENTIWVDTDRINNYYFSATQPEGMVDYDVWFPVGTSSPVEFNALKKNGIQVYPMAAKQYVSGVCRDVVAKIYQGWEWVDWATYLFKAGEGAKIEFVSNSESNAAINITNDYIELTTSGGRAIINTKNKISTAEKSALVADVILTDILNSQYPLALCLTNKPYAIGVYDIATYTELKTTGSHVQTVQVPLDTLSGGEYYFALTGTVKAKVQNWYMR